MAGAPSSIDKPEKNSKSSQADVKERDFWDDYQRAFAAALGATSTTESPCYGMPADDKKNARLIVFEVILDALRDLKMDYREPMAKRRRELHWIRKTLVKEQKASILGG